MKYGMAKIIGITVRESRSQPWNVSSIAQAAGLAALKEKEYVEEGRRIIFEELAYLKKELTELGYPVYPSQANYVFFEGPENLYDQLEQKKILIRHCPSSLTWSHSAAV